MHRRLYCRHVSCRADPALGKLHAEIPKCTSDHKGSVNTPGVEGRVLYGGRALQRSTDCPRRTRGEALARSAGRSVPSAQGGSVSSQECVTGHAQWAKADWMTDGSSLQLSLADSAQTGHL